MNNSFGALEIAQKYFDAVASKNVNAVIALCDENITTHSPRGPLTGIEAFKRFTEGFARMMEKVTPVSILGWEGKATIVYLADTLPVKNAYVAEHLTIVNGKITSNTTIYDSAPFSEYASRQPQHQ